MYLRSYFTVEDNELIWDQVDATPLAVLVSACPDLQISHMPAVIHREEGVNGTLYSHVPRRDPIRKNIDTGAELRAIFVVSGAYVSPSWYAEPYLPTYNHVAIHAIGTPQVIDDERRVGALLAELTDKLEGPDETSWRLEDADEHLVSSFLAGLLMFKLPVTRFEAKFKLSQNRSADDRAGIQQGLRERGDERSRAIAALMDSFPYASEEATVHELLGPRADGKRSG